MVLILRVEQVDNFFEFVIKGFDRGGDFFNK